MNVQQLRDLLSGLPEECSGWPVAVEQTAYEHEAVGLRIWPPDDGDAVWPEGVVFVVADRQVPDPQSGGTLVTPEGPLIV